MAEKRITLDTAAFLDSDASRALADVPRDAQKKFVQRFLACCYDDLAKEPRLLDGDDLTLALTQLLPRHFGKRDPLAVHADAILNAYLRFLRDTALVPHAYELGVALDAQLEAFQRVVHAGSAHADGLAVTRRFETQHRGSKVGRNDPCPCGSGKKFKKCCMQLG